MKLKSSIATSENGFLFNPATGDSFAANPLATEILRLLQAGTAISDLKAQLLARYAVTAPQLDADFDDFLAQLREHHLLDA